MRYAWITLALIFLLPSGAGAKPSTTMSVTPSATSGTTITASDENSRNNTISTTFNSHDHTDISQTANTLNLGDGTAGNKTLCGNAANSPNSCIRWDDTNKFWIVNQPTTASYNAFVVSSGTAGLAQYSVLLGNGTASLITVSGLGTSGQALVSNGAATAPTFQATTASHKVGSFTRDQTLAGGNIGYTGIGFTPKSLDFFCAIDGATGGDRSYGVDDCTSRKSIYFSAGSTVQVDTADSINVQTGGAGQSGFATTCDSDGFTIAWTKNGAPGAGTITCMYRALR